MEGLRYFSYLRGGGGVGVFEEGSYPNADYGLSHK